MVLRTRVPNPELLSFAKPRTIAIVLFSCGAFARGMATDPLGLRKHNDMASASLIENWIDEVERRTWFLFEATGVARE